MSSEQNQLVVAGPKASDQLASFLGIEKGMMLETLKAQCFKGKRPDEVSDSQLAAFVSTANVLQVNPLVPGMLYAYPERNGGITPILGPDGVFKKLDEFITSGKLTGFECEVHMSPDGKPERAEATIHRGGDNKPAKYTAYFSEWCVTSNPNWQARPRHMLWVRAIKQAARQVIHGLPMDADEYEIAQMQNVTGTAEPVAPDRPAPKPRSPKGAALVKENPAAKVVDAVVEPVVEPAPEPANPLHAEGEKIVAEADAKAAAQTGGATANPAQTARVAATSVNATPKPAVKVTQRARLNDGEILVVEAQVDAFKKSEGLKDGKKIDYVSAEIVSPEFKGTVADLSASPLWTLDDPLKLTLRGGPKRVFVEKVEALPETPAAVQDEF